MISALCRRRRRSAGRTPGTTAGMTVGGTPARLMRRASLM
jgi:hypothetical protein